MKSLATVWTDLRRTLAALAFCERQPDIGLTLTRRTLPVPFVQTYSQRTKREISNACESDGNR